jgi:DNA-binding MarR family transcriptional regulator
MFKHDLDQYWSSAYHSIMVDVSKPSFTTDRATGLTLFPPLTDRQMEVLAYVYQTVTRDKAYPTQREIAAAMGYNQNAAQQFLDALVKKGYLVKDPSIARRNIRLTELAMEKMMSTNQLEMPMQ